MLYYNIWCYTESSWWRTIGTKERRENKNVVVMRNFVGFLNVFLLRTMLSFYVRPQALNSLINQKCILNYYRNFNIVIFVYLCV